MNIILSHPLSFFLSPFSTSLWVVVLTPRDWWPGTERDCRRQKQHERTPPHHPRPAHQVPVPKRPKVLVSTLASPTSFSSKSAAHSSVLTRMLGPQGSMCAATR
eukprot:1479134-Rhodomonas_salina.2